MDDYIDVRIDVFEHTGQRARLRRSLTVNALIEEILREFDDITADSPEKYAIYLKGVDDPLKPIETLAQLDIQPQDELVFDYMRQILRHMLDAHNYATLREEGTGKEFDIQWQPAVIGRPSTDVDHNIILAVNVQLLPDGVTISRRHAQITFSEGRYFVEPLVEQNPVFLNGKGLPVHSKREIRNGDQLAFGNRKLTMTFSTRDPRDSSSVARESVSQPVEQLVTLQEPSPPLLEPAPSLVDADAAHLTRQVSSPVLTVEAGSVPGRIGEHIELAAFPFVIGRLLTGLSSENEVSRKHAEITFDPKSNSFLLTDLKSTNGVSINGQKIPPDTPHVITPGARIGLGSILVLRFDA